MGYSFDFFASDLKCLNCGKIAVNGGYENMQTYLRDDPKLEDLGVGSFVGESFHDMIGKRYFETHRIESDDKILLDMWYCPHCQFLNWACVIVNDKRIIEEIRSTQISLESLSKSDYISLNVAGDAKTINEIFSKWR